MSDYGYIQRGAGTAGPFCTERVPVKHEYADRYLALFDGRWRRVHIQVGRLYIVYRGMKFSIVIEGL